MATLTPGMSSFRVEASSPQSRNLARETPRLTSFARGDRQFYVGSGFAIVATSLFVRLRPSLRVSLQDVSTYFSLRWSEAKVTEQRLVRRV